MIHHGHRLPFGLETGDDLTSVHARLDHFQGNQTTDRIFLFSQIDDPHASLPDLLQEFVRADLGADLIDSKLVAERGNQTIGRCIQGAVFLLVCL